MQRPFSFLSGEWKISMPAVFSMNKWQHSCTAERLLLRDGDLYRSSRPGEPMKGVIMYADLENKTLERDNLLTVINSRVPCWPNPGVMLRMLDRHMVFAGCVAAGLVVGGHKTLQLPDTVTGLEVITMIEAEKGIGYPYVLKTGNLHRGEGKHLVRNAQDLVGWSGVATIEPFFVGRSVRVLVIGGEVFGIEATNGESWIKNTAGADIHEFDLSGDVGVKMTEHAMSVCKWFELDVAGVDYILQDDGVFRFLEVNWCPGFPGFDNVVESATRFFKGKMREIEGRTV